MRRALLPVFLVVTSGCGAPDGPLADTTYFWKLAENTFEFGQCSDEPDFRAGVKLDSTAGKYLIYRVSSDGKTATSLDCTTLDPATCKPLATGGLWTIAGKELTITSERRDPIGASGCSQLQTVTWTARDKGRSIDVEVTNVLSLVENQAACDAIDEDLKSRSPNMLGFAGCVLTARLTGERIVPR